LCWGTIKSSSDKGFAVKHSFICLMFIKTCKWKSSNTRAVSVNSKGIITARDAGVSTITVTTDDGGFTAQCEVTVYYHTGVNSISASRILIYPNPVTDGLINIKLNGQEEDAIIKIYNIIGESVCSATLTKGETVQFNDKLAPGLYLVRVSGKAWNEVRKIEVK
jgi:hypothetical protein